MSGGKASIKMMKRTLNPAWLMLMPISIATCAIVGTILGFRDETVGTADGAEAGTIFGGMIAFVIAATFSSIWLAERPFASILRKIMGSTSESKSKEIGLDIVGAILADALIYGFCIGTLGVHREDWNAMAWIFGFVGIVQVMRIGARYEARAEDEDATGGADAP